MAGSFPTNPFPFNPYCYNTSTYILIAVKYRNMEFQCRLSPYTRAFVDLPPAYRGLAAYCDSTKDFTFLKLFVLTLLTGVGMGVSSGAGTGTTLRGTDADVEADDRKTGTINGAGLGVGRPVTFNLVA